MSSMYTLTAMTGKEASASRTVVIGTIEFNYRVWMILVFTTPVALIITAILWVGFGQYAIFSVPVCYIAALFLIHRRQSSGLKLRTYQAIWDKRKAATDQFFLCGQPIKIGQSDYRNIKPNSVAYVPPAAAPSTALVDELMNEAPTAGIVPVAHRPDPGVATHRSPVLELEAPAPTVPAVEVSVAPPLDPMTLAPEYRAGYQAGLSAAQIAPSLDSAVAIAEEFIPSAPRVAPTVPLTPIAPAPATFQAPAFVAPPVIPVAPEPQARQYGIDHLDDAYIGIEGVDPDQPDLTRIFNESDRPRRKDSQ
jgi:hypothetical protein